VLLQQTSLTESFINNRYLFLIVLESGKLKIKAPGLVSAEVCFQLPRYVLVCCVLVAEERERKKESELVLFGLFYEVVGNSFLQVNPS
jgi:hypothetical protein